MNPTWYDVLGISRDASREQIREAWREAADRLEPGTGSPRRFRLVNEAAEVLLDPARRAAYDATLGEEPPEPATTLPGPPLPGASPVATPAPSSASATPTGTGPGGRVAPWWVLGLLGVLAAVAVGFAAYFVTQAQRAEEYQEALDRAPAAAESAAAAVLSYHHESLEADRDAAARFLTEGYRDDYLDTFDKLVAETARETRATVEAEVLASSAMLGGGAGEHDPDRVPVLLFVNQSSTSTASSTGPSLALNRVRFDMVEVDGTWLVDGITSY